MNVSILTVVLASSLLAGQNANPAWQTSYTQARQQAAVQKKPLAVVFGAGAKGWSKVVRDAAPSADVAKLLAANYVCVYVDTTSPAGKTLAAGFDITGSVGIVLSDRAGTSQAFWHQGDMTNQNLVRYLQKYADPQVMVRGTETVGTSRTSFYPPSAAGAEWDGASSYCPSCNNVRSRR